MTIAQGFANHINLNPEAHRAQFVSHEGRKRLEFWSDYLPGTKDLPWNQVIAEFSTLAKKEIGDANHSMIVGEFSTTDAAAKAASEAALLDSMQSYFEYYGGTRCGIPRITLEGTPDDWQKLHQKVTRLAEFGGLDFWLDKVKIISGQLVDASNGKVDQQFWHSLFKINDMSGGLRQRLDYASGALRL